MTYKQVLFPNKDNPNFEMPEQFFGKKVEVVIIDLSASSDDSNPIPPPAKKISVSELFESFGAAPDFPSVDEIRRKVWPSKW